MDARTAAGARANCSQMVLYATIVDGPSYGHPWAAHNVIFFVSCQMQNCKNAGLPQSTH